MTITEFVEKCNKNKIIDNVSILKSYSEFVNNKALFYISKRKLLSRIINDFKLKYEVFENSDLEYGRKANVRYFCQIEEATNYLWELIKNRYHIND